MAHRSFTALIVALALVTLSCGGHRESLPAFPVPERKLLVVELVDLPAQAALPGAIALRDSSVAHARFSPTGYPSDTLAMAERVAADAAGQGYLCMLSDVAPPLEVGQWEERTNIVLRSRSGSVELTPPELSPDVNRALWHSWRGRQQVIAGILEKYQPDVVVMRLRPSSASEVYALLDFWTIPRSEGGTPVNLVIYSPPRPAESYRGWAALCGPAFSGGMIEGLTYRGLLSTMRAVMGAADTLRAAAGTAAIEHLTPRGER